VPGGGTPLVLGPPASVSGPIQASKINLAFGIGAVIVIVAVIVIIILAGLIIIAALRH
jgi:hypothetical protein